MLQNIFWVALGGASGSIFRYLLAVWLQSPWATLLANISGCWLIGFLSVFLPTSQMPPSFVAHRFLWITGFCGGYTTFSTFSLEVWQQILEKNYSSAVLYSFGSVFLGLLAVFMGIWVGNLLNDW